MAKLIWSPKSLNELKDIFDYIAVDSREYALVIVRKLIEAATTIPDFHLSGRVVPEFKNEKVRVKIFKNYRIIYRVLDDCIEIVTVFHNARQLTEKDV